MILHLLERKGYRRVLLYALPALLYCLTSILLNRLMNGHSDIWSLLGFELFFLLVCYGFSRVLDLLFSPKYWHWGALVLVLFAFTVSVGTYYYVYELMPGMQMQITRPDVAFSMRKFLQNCVLGMFRAFSYGLIYYMLKQLRNEAMAHISETEARLAAERQLALEEEEKNAYRTALLTSQIYPHFLENTLTMVGGMAAERKDMVMVDAVLKLASLMRYLSEKASSLDQLVYLQEEWQQVNILLDMIGLQRGSPEVVQQVQRGVPRPLAIPPLVLLTLVENALKYGEISLASPLLLSLHFDTDVLVFTCANKKKTQLAGVESTKMGLQNISHRLTLLLPGRFDLQVKDEDNWFRVSLSIAYQ